MAVATRDVSVPGTDPPLNVRAKSTPGTGGATLQCTADKRAVVYWFGWGTDPSNPDAWTGSAIESGVKHVVTGFPVGTKLYFRMLVQRTRVGKGVWSDVVEVTVR